MTRRPDGTTTATESRTAVLAAVAARSALSGGTRHRPSFVKRHRLKVSDRDISRALQLRLRQLNAPPPADRRAGEWLWESYEVDVAKLGLDLTLAWFPRPHGPGPRANQSELLQALRDTPEVLRLYDCFDDTVVVVSLSEGPQARRDLQDHFRKLCPEVHWAEARHVERDQPERGWLHAVTTVARSELRLRAK